jgi:hypothetical protein
MNTNITKCDNGITVNEFRENSMVAWSSTDQTLKSRFRLPPVAQLFVPINHPNILERSHPYERRYLAHLNEERWSVDLRSNWVPQTKNMKQMRSEQRYISSWEQIKVQSTLHAMKL